MAVRLSSRSFLRFFYILNIIIKELKAPTVCHVCHKAFLFFASRWPFPSPHYVLCIDHIGPDDKAKADTLTFLGRKRHNTRYHLGFFCLKIISIPRTSALRTRRLSCLSPYLCLSAAAAPNTYFSGLQLPSLFNVFLLLDVCNLTTDKDIFWLIGDSDTEWLLMFEQISM